MFKRALVIFGGFLSTSVVAAGEVFLYSSLNQERERRNKLIRSLLRFKNCDLSKIKSAAKITDNLEIENELNKFAGTVDGDTGCKTAN